MLNLCRGPTFRGKHSEVFQNTTNLLKKLSKDFGGASFQLDYDRAKTFLGHLECLSHFIFNQFVVYTPLTLRINFSSYNFESFAYKHKLVFLNANVCVVEMQIQNAMFVLILDIFKEYSPNYLFKSHLVLFFTTVLSVQLEELWSCRHQIESLILGLALVFPILSFEYEVD